MTGARVGEWCSAIQLRGSHISIAAPLQPLKGRRGEEERGLGLVGGQGANLGDEKLRLVSLFPSPGRGAVGHVSETRAEKVI